MRTKSKTKTQKIAPKTRKINKKSSPKNSTSEVDKLVKVAKSQEKVISSLLEVIKTGKNQPAVVAENKRVIRRNKSTETPATGRDSKESLDKEFKKYNYELFLEGLHKIGRPAMTKEIAERMRKDPKFKRITRNKKRFMQFLYSSVSHFVKQGVLKRKPIGQKSYEYSLKKTASKRLANAA